MKDLKQLLQNYCYGQPLDQRRRWYSPAAEAYHQVRPRYPRALLQRVTALTKLSDRTQLLEIGCGPAIATPAFAELGCEVTCIEPNPDFVHIARRVCQPYPKVSIQHCAFEEWIPEEGGRFDAVLAASSLHWVSPEVAYPKAASLLRPDGYLILLWNKELQPHVELFDQMVAVYGQHAPSLRKDYEDPDTQLAILNQMGQMAVDSGQFSEVTSGWQSVEVTYTVDEYLLLLGTYSPQLALEPQQRQQLFEGLRQVLEQQGPDVELSYVSAFHIARPAG